MREVWFDQELIFSFHINVTVNKALELLGFMNTTCTFMNFRNNLFQTTRTLVLTFVVQNTSMCLKLNLGK